jgi:hypothetical protein
MKRVRLNALVDLLAFPALLLSFFAGIIPWKVLPSGGGPRAGREAAHALFLGLTRGEWRDIHVYASLVFGGLLLTHLLLHWRWILCVPKLFSRASGRRRCPAEVLGSAQEPGTGIA